MLEFDTVNNQKRETDWRDAASFLRSCVVYVNAT